MNSKSVIKVFGAILTLLLLIFAYRYIAELVKEADLSGSSINWVWLAVSAVTFLTSYILFAIHWRMACEMIEPSNSSITERQSLSFFASQPYKYLPTSLFSFSYRAVYAKKLGLGIAKSSAAQMVEYTSMLSANFFLFTLFYTSTLDMRLASLEAVLGFLMALGFLRVKKFKIKIKNKNLHIDPPKLVCMVALATTAWLISGMAFVLLNQALGLEIRFGEMVAANCLAFSLSILAVFAPGGIGVRELVYSTFSISNVAIIYWRILTFILDCVSGLIAILVIRSKTKDA